MSARTLLVATRNPGKLVELRDLFDAIGVALIDLDAAGLPESREEDALEAYDTFEANALAKASYFHARSGLPTVADDSGLAVRALGGAPGVHSKRYSGVQGSSDAVAQANNAKLMAALEGHAERGASFVCAAAYVDDATRVVTRGEVQGRVETVGRGHGGFGYDPYFFSDEIGKTFAEASVREKGAVSHRARAFTALVARLREASELGLGSG